MSLSLMPKKYVSLFLFSFVLLDRFICNLVFLLLWPFIFYVIIHFVDYSCAVSKTTCTRLNLECEALSAICSTRGNSNLYMLYKIKIITTIKRTTYSGYITLNIKSLTWAKTSFIWSLTDSSSLPSILRSRRILT